MTIHIKPRSIISMAISSWAISKEMITSQLNNWKASAKSADGFRWDSEGITNFLTNVPKMLSQDLTSSVCPKSLCICRPSGRLNDCVNFPPDFEPTVPAWSVQRSSLIQGTVNYATHFPKSFFDVRSVLLVQICQVQPWGLDPLLIM